MLTHACEITPNFAPDFIIKLYFYDEEIVFHCFFNA